MNEKEWYEVTEGPALMQGDILRNCPVLLQPESPQWPLSSQIRLQIQVKEYDLVIMTQSCDLANDKVEDILFAQLIAWQDAVTLEVKKGNEAVRSSKFRKQLIEGSVPSLSLLQKRDEAPALAWSVIDFHRLFVLPKMFVSPFAASLGPRLRLRSPYREHLAQAFARYFMRVGLPHDAKAFEKEGDVKV